MVDCLWWWRVQESPAPPSMAASPTLPTTRVGTRDACDNGYCLGLRKNMSKVHSAVPKSKSSAVAELFKSTDYDTIHCFIVTDCE